MQHPQNVTELEDLLSRPTPGVYATLRNVSGDIVLLGAGGKLGPTLARMVRRGLDEIGAADRRVLAVSRFTSEESAKRLSNSGVEIIRADLMDPAAVSQLPEAPNVLYLVGQKFGTGSAPGLTWVTNTVVPAWVADRYRDSRIVALSTGCVYPLMPSEGPGADEQTPLDPPGEYAQSCVGRERVFEHYARLHGTSICFVRLCYAIDLRYGVLLDLAQKIVRDEPVDVSMGATNVIWQGDANARIIQCLGRTANPPAVVNVTGRGRHRIRDLALRLGQLLERDVKFVGEETPTAWIWNAELSYDWFGSPAVGIDEMLAAVAHWVRMGGDTLNRPTHFEVRDGRF